MSSVKRKEGKQERRRHAFQFPPINFLTIVPYIYKKKSSKQRERKSVDGFVEAWQKKEEIELIYEGIIRSNTRKNMDDVFNWWRESETNEIGKGEITMKGKGL